MSRKIKALTAVLFLSALPLLSACTNPLGPLGGRVVPDPVECNLGDTQFECEP